MSHDKLLHEPFLPVFLTASDNYRRLHNSFSFYKMDKADEFLLKKYSLIYYVFTSIFMSNINENRLFWLQVYFVFLNRHTLNKKDSQWLNLECRTTLLSSNLCFYCYLSK